MNRTSGEPVAVVDCGTNTIRLLIADDAGELLRRSRIVRLGQGVDAAGEFHPDALVRTFTALGDYAHEIRRHTCGRVRFVATSATRDVTNRQVFLAGVRQRLPGAVVDVLSGAQEARYSFAGAVAGIGGTVPGPVLVSDVGGGSSELVLDGAGVSLDLGAVRLRERLLATDPPTSAEIDAATTWADALLAGCSVDLAAARTWIAVAGTATTLAALDQGLAAYDRERVHGYRMPLPRVESWARRLLAMPVARIAALPAMEPGRAGVIGAGALICARIAARTSVREMIVSETDILDGVAMELLAG